MAEAYQRLVFGYLFHKQSRNVKTCEPQGKVVGGVEALVCDVHVVLGVGLVNPERRGLDLLVAHGVGEIGLDGLAVLPAVALNTAVVVYDDAVIVAGGVVGVEEGGEGGLADGAEVALLLVVILELDADLRRKNEIPT